MTITKSLQYPLLALTISDKECKHIMTPVLEGCLTKSHICHNFPRSVAYGPIAEKVLELSNIYTIKGLTQISSIVQFLGETHHFTGKLLRASIEVAKVEMDTGKDLFGCNYWKYECLLTKTWIKGVRKFLWKRNITLIEDKTTNLTLQQENNTFIMEDIIIMNMYSKAELQHINRCRIYFQASTLSDIVTGDGNCFSY